MIRRGKRYRVVACGKVVYRSDAFVAACVEALSHRAAEVFDGAELVARCKGAT